LERVATGGQKIELPEDCKSNELFAFIYAPDVDTLVHDRPTVREYWKQQREQPTDDSGPADLRCLVTGQEMRDVGLFPLIKRVPGGATAGVGLVSFNKSAFWSHGWENNENAPVSRSAAEGCATALNRLLSPAYPDPKNPNLTLRPHHIRLSDDTVVCYWAHGQRGAELADWMSDLLNASDPDKVADVYRSLWTGRMPKLNDPSAFYAVTLSGAQGRAVVRDWFETTVGKVTDNLARHFGDLAIVRNTPPPKNRALPPVLPLLVLLRSLAPMGDEKGIPDPLAAQFIHAAMQGRPYPYAVLQKALERTRAEIGRTEWGDLERRDARAALIKAVLLRRTDNKIGYNLGCLMAVLERLQETAMENVNASVIDRYFGAASATPRSVFVRLLRNAQHHARKARDSEKSAGLAFLLKNLMDEFIDRFHIDAKKPGYPIADGIPAFLPLDQQGLFVVGYHQMRKWLWMTKDERTAWMKDYPEAPRAFQWGGKVAPQAIEA
jgi:CRISPR-associated protein Csd1